MQILLEIPKEFESDYKGDTFKDFFSRVLCDIENGTLCGNYEKETTEMFLKAFDESKIIESVKGDLISRSDVIKALSIFNDRENGNKHFIFGIETAKEIVDNQPTAYNDGWIPCEKQMPPVETEIWIVAKRKWKDGSFRYITTTAMYEDGTMLENDSCWRWEDIEGEWNEEEDCYIIPEGWWENKHYNADGEMNHAVDDEVIAWQPLPLAYQPKGE